MRLLDKDNSYVLSMVTRCIQDVFKCTDQNVTDTLRPRVTKLFLDVISKKLNTIRGNFRTALGNYCKLCLVFCIIGRIPFLTA